MDKSARTVTFKVPAPITALRTLKSLHPGARVKVTAPFDQPSDTAVISAMAPAT